MRPPEVALPVSWRNPSEQGYRGYPSASPPAIFEHFNRVNLATPRGLPRPGLHNHQHHKKSWRNHGNIYPPSAFVLTCLAKATPCRPLYYNILCNATKLPFLQRRRLQAHFSAVLISGQSQPPVCNQPYSQSWTRPRPLRIAMGNSERCVKRQTLLFRMM
jgi:hypothetical protein